MDSQDPGGSVASVARVPINIGDMSIGPSEVTQDNYTPVDENLAISIEDLGISIEEPIPAVTTTKPPKKKLKGGVCISKDSVEMQLLMVLTLLPPPFRHVSCHDVVFFLLNDVVNSDSDVVVCCEIACEQQTRSLLLLLPIKPKLLKNANRWTCWRVSFAK